VQYQRGKINKLKVELFTDQDLAVELITDGPQIMWQLTWQ
jgi:hypothetical protein